MTDGTFILNSRSRNQTKQSAFVERTPARAFTRTNQNQLVPLHFSCNNAARIAQIQRLSGLGSIVIPGDFGIRVFE